MRTALLLSVLAAVAYSGFAAEPGDSEKVLFPIVRSGKWGYINKLGDVVVEPRFDEALTFSEGHGAVRIREKWGWIDATGEMIIKSAPWSSVAEFSGGLARVRKGEAYGFVDTKGRTAIETKFDFASHFRERLAWAVQGERRGYIDTRGHFVIGANVEMGRRFHEGLAAVAVFKNKKKRDLNSLKWGFIDRLGKMTIDPVYSQVSDFSEGTAAVNLNGSFDNAEGLLQGGAWGFIDVEGKTALPFEFEDADRFACGRARVKVVDAYHFIDKRGRTVFDADNAVDDHFREGALRTKHRGQFAFVDVNGKELFELPKGLTAGRFSHGLAPIRTDDGRLGYVNLAGKVVWKPAK